MSQIGLAMMTWIWRLMRMSLNLKEGMKVGKNEEMGKQG